MKVDLLTSLPLMQETLLGGVHDWEPVKTVRYDIVGRWQCRKCHARLFIRHIPNTRLWADYYDVSGYGYGKEEPPCSR